MFHFKSAGQQGLQGEEHFIVPSGIDQAHVGETSGFQSELLIEELSEGHRQPWLDRAVRPRHCRRHKQAITFESAQTSGPRLGSTWSHSDPSGRFARSPEPIRSDPTRTQGKLDSWTRLQRILHAVKGSVQ